MIFVFYCYAPYGLINHTLTIQGTACISRRCIAKSFLHGELAMVSGGEGRIVLSGGNCAFVLGHIPLH